MKPIRSSLALLLALAPLLARAVTFTTDTTINAGDATYDAQDIVVSGCTLTVNGPHSFNSLQIVSSGILTHTAAASGQSNNQVNLTIAQNVLVDATSRIDVTGKGYHPGFSGPGAGASLVGTIWDDWAGGGGYGGWGATSSVGLAGGAPYGSITQPTDWGSDGGSCPSHNATGGSGGGAVRLLVGGTLTVSGQILARGTGDATAPGGAGDGEIGGGSGGSIWLTVTTLAGQGTISADGGNGDTDDDSGGGGGGRVAIYYGTNNFAGAISAVSSSISSIIGGAGTIYTKASTQTTGQVLVDNGGSAGADTGLTSPEAFALTITNGGSGVAMAPLTLGALHIATNGSLKQLAGSSNLTMVVLSNAVIDSGGALTLDGKGYPVGTNRGPGVASDNSTYYAGGGGYGGLGGSAYGGSPGGPVYGSMLQPVDLGSAGAAGIGQPGSPGGGALQLTVNGTLTVNGIITANGGPLSVTGYHGGCGSGGSLWLNVGTLQGGGVISANGGSGPADGDGGAGGGGRIAIYYTNATGFNLASQVTALGGGPFNLTSVSEIGGGAGTIYLKAASATVGDLLIANGGNSGMLTPLTSPQAFNVTITSNAAVDLASGSTFTSLHIISNSFVTADSSLGLTILSNATIDAGAALTLDGKGYPLGANRGPGVASDNSSYYAGGAGYGGLGGSAWRGSPGGPTYGSLMQPADLGSAGAAGIGQPGSPGGGALQLTVNGTLTLNGIITANGGPLSVTGYHGGCGSGGSLWLNVGTLQGGGVISANGGSGPADGDGGAGGGGRIAIYYTNAGGFNFASQVSALGGGPFNWTNVDEIGAGAGTIYLKPASATVGNVLIANGGNSGMLTPLTSPEAFNLTVTNSAGVAVSHGLTVSSLSVASNSYLTCLAGDPGLNVVVLGNALVDSSSALNVDGLGYPIGTNLGPGVAPASPNFYAGGGGYGGAGGAGWGGSPGGGTNGSVTQPVDLGSAGGTGNGQPGTAGGGAIRFTVSGTLSLNGALSAGGISNPGGFGGAGSGGSIWLTAGTLQGTGTISASGGSASSSDDGGGGGGGRIAVYYTQTNGFNLTNQLSVAGGGPFDSYHLNGSPGTVFLSSVMVAPAITSATPNGGAARPLASHIDLVFNVAIDPATFTTVGVAVTAPSGAIPAAQLTVSNTGGTQWRIGFPMQTANGHYQYQIGPHIANLSGAQMAAAYAGSFDISQTSWPNTIQFSAAGGGAVCAMPSLAGMNYQLLVSTNLVNWQASGLALPGTGTTLDWNLSTLGSAGFYRVQVSETP